LEAAADYVADVAKAKAFKMASRGYSGYAGEYIEEGIESLLELVREELGGGPGFYA
jgi:hypothetical protein